MGGIDKGFFLFVENSNKRGIGVRRIFEPLHDLLQQLIVAGYRQGGKGPVQRREISRTLGDFLFQSLARLLQCLGHPIELVRQALDFIAGVNLQPVLEIALGDALGSGLQLAHRAGDSATEISAEGKRAGDRESKNGEERPLHRSELSQSGRFRLFDDHGPSKSRNL